MHPRFTIRAALPQDHAGVLALSRFLDSANLPNDTAAIDKLLRLSEDSFSCTLKKVNARKYLFMIVDEQENQVVGTSMIIAQLGKKEAPYVYFDIHREERYSDTLDKHFDHQVLTVRYSYNGPTEIGGLVVHPDYRQSKHRVGMLISYVRFLWIAMNRPLCQNQILAELMPPLNDDGSSYLWEAVGRRFTDMTYHEADRLSKTNKEFIRSLFPRQSIYATLLPKEARDVIGEVSPHTKGVEKLLRRIGFEYANRVDPFDGGPDFIAQTDDISLVQNSKQFNLHIAQTEPTATGFVAKQSDKAPYFIAVLASCQIEEKTHTITVEEKVANSLQADEGDLVWVLPFGSHAHA